MFLTALALLPGIMILIYIFRKDKVEREPVSLIVKLVVFGAFSCAPAAFLETYMDGFVSMFQQGTVAYAVAISFLSAGLMEEGCKFLLLKLGSWRNREFNYRFDGIVYGVAVACGFAMLENVMYVFQGGISVAITRAFMSVPLHAFCGAFMGAFYGMAKYKAVNGQKSDAFKCQICALIVPITIHGIFDSICFLDWNGSYYALVVYTVILYFIGIKMINALERDDAEMCFYGQQAAYGSTPSYEADPVYESNAPYEYVPSYESVEELDPIHHDRVRTTNGMSIASLICGIASFITMSSLVLPPLLAVIFGIIGRKQTGKNVKNTAAAAGIILGCISIAVNVYVIMMYMGTSFQ